MYAPNNYNHDYHYDNTNNDDNLINNNNNSSYIVSNNYCTDCTKSKYLLLCVTIFLLFTNFGSCILYKLYLVKYNKNKKHKKKNITIQTEPQIMAMSILVNPDNEYQIIDTTTHNI